MSMTAKDLLEEARSRVKSVSPEDASSDATGLILDVREPVELTSAGSPDGALHIARSLLEFKADPAIETHEPRLAQFSDGHAKVHVLCASGGRAALAAATLVRMGYDATVIEGGMSGWKKAGLDVKPV